jgi:hypothetical protein
MTMRNAVLLGVMWLLWPMLAQAQFRNAQPHISEPRFSIQQGVNTEVLAASAVVEFTVTVTNTGQTAASPGTATVRLSPDLVAAPAGTAPFTSYGSTFDIARGTWDIGDLPVGAQAVLVLPAQVVAQPAQPCAFSLAELWPDGQGPDAISQQSFGTLRAPGVTACSDLVVGVASALPRGFPYCDGKVSIQLPITNRGPDPAHDVFVSIAQVPETLPGLVFQDARCSRFGEPTCLLSSLVPGAPFWLLLGSDVFANKGSSAAFVLTATASSSDYELEPGQESSSSSLVIARFEPCEDLGRLDELVVPGCFIATAAWGSALDPHVQSLRRFRDRFLLTHAPGRKLVALYYRLSPPLADYIAVRPRARAATRALLWPLVLVVEHPASLLSLLVGGLWLARRRRASATARTGELGVWALCLVGLASSVTSDEAAAADSHAARPWPEADQAFRNDAGWLGADAALSVPLSGDRTLWLFGDSFIATSSRGHRAESRMVRNSIAIQHGRDPRTAPLQFHWRGDDAAPKSFFPERGNHWYWPGHGIRLAEGPLVVFLFTIVATPGQDLGFATVGHAIAVIDDPDAPAETWQPRIRDLPGPVFDALPATALVRAGDHVVALAIRQRGTHAGALVRYPAAQLARGRLEGAEWWAGAARGWVPAAALGPDGPALVLDDAGAECSLHQDEATGWYVHVASYGFGTTTIGVRTAPALTGPWSSPLTIYRPPESDQPRVFVYAAKAHPQLAGPGVADLVITYATNSFEFSDLFTPQGERELYWPRFVAWGAAEGIQAVARGTAERER